MPAKTLLVIIGPTAIGKTGLAIKLAQHFNTEIVSADSRQFYREMNIGTAKPTAAELSQAKHHFIDSISISEDFTVGDFEKQALYKLAEIFFINNIAILVGGSGLYINAICNGFDDLPKASPQIREKLNSVYSEKGIEALQDMLKKADPVYFIEVDQNNPQRLIRALEVYEATGEPFSSFRKKARVKRPFNILKIGLNTNRQTLYNQINERVDKMTDNGLLEEAIGLVSYKNLNALKTVGYSELFDYFNESLTLAEAIRLIKQNTRRFAKRQLTWFRKDEDIKWFEPGQLKEIQAFIDSSLRDNEQSTNFNITEIMPAP